MPTEVSGGFDAHTHLIPPGIVDAARAGALGLEVTDDRLITASARVPLKRIGARRELEHWLDEQGLDGAIVSPPPPIFSIRQQDPTQWARRLNDAMLEVCTDRTKPLALLPVDSPEAARSILDELHPDFVGAVIGTDFGQNLPSDRTYDDVWSHLVERRLPLLIHPGASPDQRLTPFYLANLVGNPVETTVVAAHLVLGGVVSRHPELKVVLAHGGGAVAQLAGRWDRGFETGRPGLAALDEKPTEIIRRLYVDSVVHASSSLSLLRSTFGDDRILFGSDWPFPMGSDSANTSFSAWPNGSEFTAQNAKTLFFPARD